MNMKLLLAPGALALGLVSLLATPAASAQRQPSRNAAGAASDLAAFPRARPGQTRHVIRLPRLGDESVASVELIVGRTMRIDCNHHMFGGKLEERTAQGWGYNYYVIDNLGQGATTLKGCPPGSQRTAFVRSSSESIVRYNSRLPLVVYTPRDVELRYRVWRAGPEQRVR